MQKLGQLSWLLVERMCKTLAPWKSSYISKDERVTLFKSTLARLPLYQMSLVKIPVAQEVGKIVEKFFLGGGDLKRKVDLVNWDALIKGGVVWG